MFMNKREFDKFVLKNINNFDTIYIRVWNGFDDDNNDASWLEVYFEMEDYPSVYTSDYVPEKDEYKKDLYKEQNNWNKKITKWITNYNKDIKIIVDEQNI